MGSKSSGPERHPDDGEPVCLRHPRDRPQRSRDQRRPDVQHVLERERDAEPLLADSALSFMRRVASPTERSASTRSTTDVERIERLLLHAQRVDVGARQRRSSWEEFYALATDGVAATRTPTRPSTTTVTTARGPGSTSPAREIWQARRGPLDANADDESLQRANLHRR